MKTTALSIIVAGVLIGGSFLFARGGNGIDTPKGPANNVTIENGIQIIEIRAKGGYQPRKSVAAAGIPTIIRFNTTGTFDCSSAVRIPSMDISETLPQSGSTDIDIGTQKLGTLKGSCGMGMYPFEVEFRG